MTCHARLLAFLLFLALVPGCGSDDIADGGDTSGTTTDAETGTDGGGETGVDEGMSGEELYYMPTRTSAELSDAEIQLIFDYVGSL